MKRTDKTTLLDFHYAPSTLMGFPNMEEKSRIELIAICIVDLLRVCQLNNLYGVERYRLMIISVDS